MPQQGGSPLEPAFLGGLSTPGGHGPASFTSVLITVWHARHVIGATEGQRSVDLGFSVEIPASVVQSLPLHHEHKNECELIEDLQWM